MNAGQFGTGNKRATRYTPKEREKLIEQATAMRQQNMPYHRIAEELGLAKATLHQWLHGRVGREKPTTAEVERLWGPQR